MDTAGFIKHIVMDILKENISSDKYYDLGGSYNTLWQCVDRNKGIGKRVITLLSNLIIKSTKYDQNKKNEVLNFLKQFLTENELESLNTENDIKIILEMVAEKFKNKKVQNDLSDIMIVNIFELQQMGWTLEKYMLECFKLWNDSVDDINGMPDEHKGNLDQWVKIINNHPHNRRILVTKKNELIGFWDFVTLFDEDFEKAKNGELNDSDLEADCMPYLLSGIYNIYITSIMVKESYRGILLRPMLFSMARAFEEFAEQNIFINKIVAWAYTKSGITLCRGIGLDYVKDHKEEGKIFYGEFQNLFDNFLFKDFKKLKELYTNLL